MALKLINPLSRVLRACLGDGGTENFKGENTMKRTILFMTTATVLLFLQYARADTLSLEQAVRTALDNNPEIAAADKEAQATGERIGEVKSNVRPHLDLGFSYIHLEEAPTLEVPPINIDMSDMGSAINQYFQGTSTQLQALGMPGLPAFPTQLSKTLTLPGFELAEQDTRRATLSMQYALFTGGRVKQNVERIRRGANAQDAMAQSQRKATTMAVIEAYLGAVLARRAARVNDEAYATMQWHVNQAESLYRQGMIARYDLMRAHTELGNQDHRRIEAHNQADLALAFLLDLMGMPDAFPQAHEPVAGDSGDYAPTVELTTALGRAMAPETDYEQAVATALERSSRRQALQEKDAMFGAGIRAAQAEHNPTAALVASRELRDEDLPVTTPESYIGVVVTLPLLDGGGAKARANHQRKMREQNQETMRRLDNAIHLEVRKSLLDLEAARKALDAAATSLDLASESLRLARRRYEVGEGTSMEVTDAILAHSLAETNLDRTRYQYDLACYGLKRSLGIILDEFQISEGGVAQ